MDGMIWVFSIVFLVEWAMFFFLVRQTKKIGYSPYKIPYFWLTLMSVSAGSILTIFAAFNRWDI